VRAIQAYRNFEAPPTVAQMLAWSAEAGIPFDSLQAVFG
jgi:hypothetical protein